MNVVVCAYRDWASSVVDSISKHPKVTHAKLACSNSELETLLQTGNIDLVLFVGWSSPPSKQLVELGVPMISEHPADSDRYSPGTPLQNQILDGKTMTKHRIVKVSYPELVLRQWSHEVDMSLQGNMQDILQRMTDTSIVLFKAFLDDYPNVTWNTWDELPIEQQVPRRTPEQSRVTTQDVISFDTEQLYNKLRCLESPYPNAFIEDDKGMLFFERVSYKKK